MTLDPETLLADHPHITVQTAILPGREWGRWLPESNTIQLDARLSAVQRKCTLMHELVHHMNGDDPEAPPWLLERQERECRRKTAEMLIETSDLLAALQWCCEQYEDELADFLDVDIPTLRDRVAMLTLDERASMARQASLLEESA